MAKHLAVVVLLTMQAAGLYAGIWKEGDLVSGAIADIAAHPTIPGLVFASTSTGIHRSSDWTAQWERVSDMPLNVIGWIPVHSLAFNPLNAREICALGDSSGSCSTDLGTTWTSFAMPGSSFLLFDPHITDRLFTGTPFGGNWLYVSDDHGRSWAARGFVDGHSSLHSAAAIDPATGAIYETASRLGRCIPACAIYRSVDSGSTWQLVRAELVVWTLATDRWGRSTLYTIDLERATNRYTVSASSDGGTTWQIRGILPLTNGSVHVLAADGNASVLFAGGDGGILFLSPDGGRTWTRIDQSEFGHEPITHISVGIDGTVYAASSHRVFALAGMKGRAAGRMGSLFPPKTSPVAKAGHCVRSPWRILLLSMTALTIGSCFEEAPPRRGPFAFHYGPSLSEEALAWYSQFDLLVTHDPLPRDQVDRLRAAGTRLVLYEWAVAFYDSRATEWQRSLLSPHDADLLNRKPLTGWVGSTTSGAWYFDPASPAHEKRRAAEIVRRIEEIGYDGVFFDTTTVESVHPEARKEYQRRHPDTPYDLAFSRFLSQLRKRLPKGILFTNQGYRSAEHYLPYVDWDLTESLVTWSGNGSHQVRAWNDHSNPWTSIHFVMLRMIEPVAARYPHVRFGHLNYVSEPSPEKVRLVVAISRLFDGEGYVAGSTILDEVDPIYFRDPGKPVSPRVDQLEGKAAWRFFEHGLIAVTAAGEEITIHNLPRKGYRDHFTGQLICGSSITIPAAAGEPRAWFFDNSPDCPAR